VKGWRDPRCWREVLIRGGVTAIMAGVILVVSGLVLLRWAIRPEGLDRQDE